MPAFAVAQLVGGAVAVAAVRLLYPRIAETADDVVVPHPADEEDPPTEPVLQHAVDSACHPLGG